MDSTTAVEQKFNVSEEVVVLLRSGDKCDAKIMDIQEIEGEMHYHVHYPELGRDFDELIPFDQADELIFEKEVDYEALYASVIAQSEM